MPTASARHAAQERELHDPAGDLHRADAACRPARPRASSSPDAVSKPMRCADSAEATKLASASAMASQANAPPCAGAIGASLPSPRRRPRGRRSLRHAQEVQRQADDEVQCRIDDEREPPADRVQQALRQRPEHRAREAAEQRQRRDAAPIRRPGELVQRRERRVVQRGAHRHAGQQPAGEQRHGPCARPACAEASAPSTDPARAPAAAVRIDRAADRGRQQPRHSEPGGEAAEQPTSPTPSSARIGGPSTAIV